MKGNKTILGSIFIIGLVSIILAGSYTGAFFSDTETSTGNTFSSGSLNLQVGDNDPVTWKLDENVMPGDSDGENISVENTGTIDGFLHINFTNLLNKENSCTEPELLAESDCNSDNIGELAENLFITVYFDNDNSSDFSNGDTLIYRGIVNNTTTSLLQAKLVDSELLSGNKENFRIDWKIDGSVGNEVQSDSVQFDIPFELTQKPKTVMNGLVGYWTFNEKGNIAYDYSGNNNDGTINGAVLTNGKSGGALSFDGYNDYVEVPDSPSLNPSDDFSAEVWFNANTITVWQGVISKLTNVNPGTGRGWNIQIGTDRNIASLMADSSGHWVYLKTNWVPSTNTWYHVVLVHHLNNTNELYVNGNLEATNTHEISFTNNPFQIGKFYTNTNSLYFNGTIDEVKIYNRALTPAEIQQNFEAGR